MVYSIKVSIFTEQFKTYTMEAIIFFVIIINAIISHIVGKHGEKREIGYWNSFWGSFLLSPLLGMMFVLASDKIKKRKIVKVVPVPLTNEQIKNNKTTNIVINCLILLIVLTIIIFSSLNKTSKSIGNVQYKIERNEYNKMVNEINNSPIKVIFTN